MYLFSKKKLNMRKSKFIVSYRQVEDQLMNIESHMNQLSK